MDISIVCVIFRSKVYGDEALVVIKLSLKNVASGFGAGWFGVLLDVVDNCLLGSNSIYWYNTSISLKEFKRRETLNFIFFLQFSVSGSIALGNVEWWVVFKEFFCCCNILWGELLAVSAPWSVEFNKKVIV